MTIKRIDPGARYSSAVVNGDTIYLAGQVAKKMAGKSVGEQTTEILEQIDALLKKAGSDKSKMLMVNIWLSDISTFDEMNKAWDAWVPKDAMPGRATVEARLADANLRVEIAVIATK